MGIKGDMGIYYTEEGGGRKLTLTVAVRTVPMPAVLWGEVAAAEDDVDEAEPRGVFSRESMQTCGNHSI